MIIGLVLFVISVLLLRYMIIKKYSKYTHIIGIMSIVISLNYIFRPIIFNIDLSIIIRATLLLFIQIIICVIIYTILLNKYD